MEEIKDYTDIMQKSLQDSSIGIYQEKSFPARAIVPVSFKVLLTELSQILAANKEKLLFPYTNAQLKIGTLQVAGFCPQLINDKKEYCCSLECYIISSLNQQEVLAARIIIVNFSTGEVMNEAKYLKLCMESEPELISDINQASRELTQPFTYAWISQFKLSLAWNHPLYPLSRKFADYRWFEEEQVVEKKVSLVNSYGKTFSYLFNAKPPSPFMQGAEIPKENANPFSRFF